jgi:hypothetical protein
MPIKQMDEQKLVLARDKVSPVRNPRILHVVGPTAAIVDLRMEEVHLATDRSQQVDIWLLVERIQPAPPSQYESRQHGSNDLMACAQVLFSRVG